MVLNDLEQLEPCRMFLLQNIWIHSALYVCVRADDDDDDDDDVDDDDLPMQC